MSDMSFIQSRLNIQEIAAPVASAAPAAAAAPVAEEEAPAAVSSFFFYHSVPIQTSPSSPGKAKREDHLQRQARVLRGNRKAKDNPRSQIHHPQPELARGKEVRRIPAQGGQGESAKRGSRQAKEGFRRLGCKSYFGVIIYISIFSSTRDGCVHPRQIESVKKETRKEQERTKREYLTRLN